MLPASALPPTAGPPAPAAVTRCLTALRKRPGQPPASARRLRLKRLRAARPFPGSRAAGQLPLAAPGRPPAGGREEAGGCVLPVGRAARREEPPLPPPGATWRAPGRERQGSGGGLPGGFAAQGGRRALPRPAATAAAAASLPPPACPGRRAPRPHPFRPSRRPGARGAARAVRGSPGAERVLFDVAPPPSQPFPRLRGRRRSGTHFSVTSFLPSSELPTEIML